MPVNRMTVPSPPRIGYRVADVVAMTGLSERTVRRWVADGTLDVVRIKGKIWVRPESVNDLFGDGA